ncbi:MAG: PepSY domain-containing protein [Eubacteriales bacterium]
MKTFLLKAGILATSLFLVGCQEEPQPVDIQTNPSGDASVSSTAGIVGAATNALLTEEEAKELALAHAEVDGSQVTFVKVNLDYDNGIPEYEIEFYVDNMEYDYEINGNTGDVLEIDYEMETARPSTGTTTPSTSTTLIGEAKAKSIALSHVGLSESQVTFVKVNLDYDDGIPEYEVEFYKDNTEYDFEIHGTTGAILEYDQDMETARPSTGTSTPSTGTITPSTGTTTPSTSITTPSTSTTLIGEAKAKSIALSHVGLSESQVTFVKVNLDYDDGVPEYEVEFYKDNTEYDFEIHGTTGTILEYDQDMETARPSTGTTTPSTSTTLIGETKAKSIALSHVGLSESQVTFVKVNLDYDDGVPEYEVEFYKDNTEYDFEIHGTTGAILEYDQDMETARPSTGTTTPSTSTTLIGEAKAKSIALSHVGLSESQVTFVKVNLDYDDGVPEYEVEFYKDNTEYDFEIHGTTGAILEYDQDMETARPSTGTSTPNTSTTLIGEAKAKSIALSHVGLSESQVTFVKVNLDYDDGIPEYEVEFYKDNTEYDFEIHGTTGAILEYDQDMETSRPSTSTPSTGTTTPSTGTTTPSTSTTLIGEAKAKSIALSHAGVSESEVSGLKVKLDYDDGVPEYEVEFNVGRTEYDYEIHGNSGTILDFDKDYD